MPTLVNTESQLTYLKESLGKHLKLETVRTENVNLNASGLFANLYLTHLMLFNLKANGPNQTLL